MPNPDQNAVASDILQAYDDLQTTSGRHKAERDEARATVARVQAFLDLRKAQGHELVMRSDVQAMLDYKPPGDAKKVHATVLGRPAQ